MKMYTFHYAYPDGKRDMVFNSKDQRFANECYSGHVEYARQHNLEISELEERDIEIPQLPSLESMTHWEAYLFGVRHKLTLRCPWCSNDSFEVVMDEQSGIMCGHCPCGFHHTYL